MPRPRLILLLALSTSAPAFAVPTGSEFPALAFLQLPRGKVARSGFPWPASQRFRSQWESADSARLIRVVEARWNGSPVVLSVEESGERLLFDAIAAKNPDALSELESAVYGSWMRTAGSLEPGGTLVLKDDERTLSLEVLRASPVGTPRGQPLWTDWTYLAVLLETDPAGEDEFPIPMGRCSMDTRPQETARRHAETCFLAGRMGCFLDFQIRIMGDQFARVASSSYGERVSATHAERLLAAGLDVPRFLRGLLARYQTEPPRRREIGEWRLGRAIAELGLPEAEQALIQVASDPSVDEFNRARATQALFFAAIAHARERKENVDVPGLAAATRAKIRDLSWSSRRSLETFGAE